MTAEVVDTNVLVTANGRESAASLTCISTCVAALQALRHDKMIVLDDGWHILREYTRNASESGQPGVGDAFLLWVLRVWKDPRHCELVSLTPKSDAQGDFEEFPNDDDLVRFDPADRRFVAVALTSRHQPDVLNATDTDWRDSRGSLERHGVRIRFLCPDAM